MKKRSEKNLFLDNQGFTLIEVLIAITILSFLMISVYSLVDNSTNAKDKVTREDRERLQVEIAMSRLETDLEFIHSPLYFESTFKDDKAAKIKSYQMAGASYPTELSKFDKAMESESYKYNGKKFFDTLSENLRPIPVIVNEEKGSIVFLTSANRRLLKNSKSSNFSWVRYRVVSTETDEDEEKNEKAPYSLTRTAINENVFSNDIDIDAAKEYSILDNLKEFTFSFWDQKKEKYVESLAELSEDETLPRLIKIAFTHITKEGDELTSVRLVRPIWPSFSTKVALTDKYKYAASGVTGGQTSVGSKGGDSKGGDDNE